MSDDASRFRAYLRRLRTVKTVSFPAQIASRDRARLIETLYPPAWHGMTALQIFAASACSTRSRQDRRRLQAANRPAGSRHAPSTSTHSPSPYLFVSTARGAATA